MAGIVRSGMCVMKFGVKAFSRARVALLLASTALASPFFVSAAVAQAHISYSIPSGNLGPALTAWARASGLKVLASSSVLSGRTTNGLLGNYRPEQALSALLAGTNLLYSVDGTTATVFDTSSSNGGSADLGGDGSVMLDVIDVTGAGDAATGSGYQGTPDWVYETPASVGVVSGEAIRNSGARNVRDAIASAPGVYSGEGQGSFPTVSPNIRGVGDSGRVVVSIDGARQNAQDGGRYGGGLGGYGAAFVDSAFIRQVDINKNPDASSGNAGSLGGGVNFRTVGADEIILPGKDWGVELNGTIGTNAHDYATSIIGAARIGESLSLTAGLSRAKLGDYGFGKHGEVTTGTAIYDMTGRESWSSLLKVEGDFGDVQASISWMHQQNDFAYSPTGSANAGSTFDATNDSISANVAWNPESSLVNAKATFWLNKSSQDELRDARVIDGIVYGTDTFQQRDLLSFGGTLENTSEFDSAVGPLTLNYGVEGFRDDASNHVMNEAIAADPRIASGWMQFNRPGQRDVASTFLNGKWEPTNWVTLSGGLRYDWYRLKGSSSYYSYRLETKTVVIPCDPVSDHFTAETYFTDVFLPTNPTWATQYDRYLTLIWPRRVNSCMSGTGVTNTTYNHLYPLTELGIDRTDGAWLPSATVEFKPLEWLRPYVSYSHSFRPPTINESFFNGGISPGDSIDTSGAANEQLRAEKARTWEVGANVIQDGVFTDEDTFRFKAAAFHRNIEDYIVIGRIRVPGESGDRLSFVNADGDTTMKGLELEGNYDAGAWWFGSAATWLETEWPSKTQVFSNELGSTKGEIFAIAGEVPPRFKVSVDAGIRLFDRRVTLGARVNHVTPNLSRSIDENGNFRELTDPYTTLDLHASFKVNDHATLNLTVDNATDRMYVPATGSYIAPGRTFLASMKARF